MKIRTADQLIEMFWTQKGMPVDEFWISPKQAAWLRDLCEREGRMDRAHWNAIPEAISDADWQPEIVAGEDRICKWGAAWIARNGAAKVSVEIGFTPDEQEAQRKRMAANAATGESWF
ncbi:hypothetical protein [Microbacterium sp.]|uniref:hypothetical protein n=1 Tax=Microbacterium sp. TaxID=51671 RepID=UPI00262C36F3|nr:hypothetical protein [Microbacterium sp.]